MAAATAVTMVGETAVTVVPGEERVAVGSLVGENLVSSARHFEAATTYAQNESPAESGTWSEWRRIHGPLRAGALQREHDRQMDALEDEAEEEVPPSKRNRPA